MHRKVRPPRSDPRQRAKSSATALLLAFTAALCSVSAMALEPLDAFPRSALEIRTATGRQWFTIRIADTDERQEQGLMFVRTLPADEGMLFPQATPRIANFWMKNTLIPLDLLFISAHGRIACIRAMAKPLRLDLISCPKPVKAVLEIGGGEAARRGIGVGDVVAHEVFGRYGRVSLPR
jgi:uncharacterized protein